MVLWNVGVSFFLERGFFFRRVVNGFNYYYLEDDYSLDYLIGLFWEDNFFLGRVG